MTRLFTKFMLTGSMVMLMGCVTSGNQYTSGQNGPVDCKDFTIQSNRKDVAGGRPSVCQVFTADNVEVVGTAYTRLSEGSSGYTNTVLQVAGPTSFLHHRDTQALLNDFNTIKKEAVDWEDLPGTEANGRKYKLKSFSLQKLKHDCIGYASYGDSFVVGYNHILYGYSCKPLSFGQMRAADIQEDLDALQVRM